MMPANSHRCALMSRRAARAARRNGGVSTYGKITSWPMFSPGLIFSSQCRPFQSLHRRFIHSMVGSFRKVVVWKHDPTRLKPATRLRLRPTHSMHHRTRPLGHIRPNGPRVNRRANLTIDRHHGFLARRVERFPREFTGGPKPLSGLLHGCVKHLVHVVPRLLLSIGRFCRVAGLGAIVENRNIKGSLSAAGVGGNRAFGLRELGRSHDLPHKSIFSFFAQRRLSERFRNFRRPSE